MPRGQEINKHVREVKGHQGGVFFFINPLSTDKLKNVVTLSVYGELKVFHCLLPFHPKQHLTPV